MIRRIAKLPLSVGSYTVGLAVVMTHLIRAGRANHPLFSPAPGDH